MDRNDQKRLFEGLANNSLLKKHDHKYLNLEQPLVAKTLPIGARLMGCFTVFDKSPGTNMRTEWSSCIQTALNRDVNTLKSY